jgi:hypothetical protein
MMTGLICGFLVSILSIAIWLDGVLGWPRAGPTGWLRTSCSVAGGLSEIHDLRSGLLIRPVQC